MGRMRVFSFLLVAAASWALPAAASAQVEIAARAARITIGGRLHTQYVVSSVDTATNQFFHRRARLQADIRIGDYLDGRVESDFAGGRTALQDGFARLTLAPALALSVGQFKRPFSVFEMVSSTDLPVIEREGTVPGERCRGVGGVCSFSRLTQQLLHDGRDLGVRVEGRFDRVAYMASLTNGQGANAADVNSAKSFAGRVELTAAPNLRLGLFGGLHDHPDLIPAVDDDDYGEAFGVDLELGTWRDGFHLLAGLVGGNHWRLGPDVNFMTVQAIASWYAPLRGPVLAGIEPLFRVSWADPDREADDVGGVLLTPGLMIYFQGRNGIAANLDSYAPDGDRGSEWSLKTQVFLYF